MENGAGWPQRKRIRLQNYDYNSPGCYFITICTIGKEKLLCDIVGTAVPGGPQINYTFYGEIAKKQLQDMSNFYCDIKIEKYVVMPNHIHLLIRVLKNQSQVPEGGPPRTSVPTPKIHTVSVNKISSFIGTFKRFCNKEYKRNIWQFRSYDHVVRDENDYLKIWNYIENNPAKWSEDRFFV